MNIARRHLTKGQQAMIAARAAAVTGLTQRGIADAQKLSKGRIGQASTVLNHAPDLADQVVSGTTPLDEAYKTARVRIERS